MTRTTPPVTVMVIGLAAVLNVVSIRAQMPEQSIEEELAAVDREIARLREADSKAEPGARAYAERLSGGVRRIKDEMADKPDAAGSAPELHVVGLYEGWFPEGPKRYGMASVRVEATHRPMILALCAYNYVRWDLELAPGAKVERIILSGARDQLLDNPPKGIAVEMYTPKNGGGKYFFTYPRSEESETYSRTAEMLREFTGQRITTLTGQYAYKGTPLVVGASNPEWQRQRIAGLLDDLYQEATARDRAAARQKLASARFPAIRWQPTARVGPPAAPGELATFTFAGPIESTSRGLPAGVNHVAIDPRGPTFYGINGRGAARLDLNANTATTLEIEGDIPEVSWPCGLAFDSKRNRLVLATLGGEGFMYAYDTQHGQWVLMRDMGGLDLQSLTYSVEHDCFYGLGHSFRTHRSLTLFCFGPDGRTTHQVLITPHMPSDHMRMHSTPYQVVALGDQVAILAAPRVEQPKPDEVHLMTCYLVDPKTGKVSYSGGLREIPAPGAALGAAELEGLARSLSAADAADTDKAIRQLAGSGDPAVAAVRSSLPPAEAADPAKVRELLARLDADQWQEREAATAQLFRLADAVEPELRNALKAANSEQVRTRISALLRRLQSVREAEGPAQELEKAIPDPNLRARLRAIRVLSRIATPAAVDLLREIASGASGSIDAHQAKVALRRI